MSSESKLSHMACESPVSCTFQRPVTQAELDVATLNMLVDRSLAHAKEINKHVQLISSKLDVIAKRGRNGGRP